MDEEEKYNQFPRGSMWSKWDLHVHTPESHGYSGTWDQFKTQLQNAECDVIGINDYFTIAGYKKIKEEISAGTLDIGNRKILPVVEMRMTDMLQNRNTETNGATHFNFHVIFNNSIAEDDIENFIKSLESGETTISTDYADKDKLKDKKVSFFETIKKLNNDIKFKDNFLIWLPYDEYGGIGDIDPNSDGWIKEKYIKKSHILGSSNQNQIDFFLWISPLKEDDTPKFTQSQFQEWFIYKKPCIKGSDSHTHTHPIGKLKDQDSNPIEKFCWIKADPTFEGLKQIVFEPEDRIRIQELKPDEKEDYQIIDKVKFIDDDFLPEDILINQNLTTIIGGKSTGKSILLRNIARTIDANEVSRRLNEVNLEEYKEQVDDFKVFWRDKQVNKRNEEDGVTKKIIYIPQSYLNRLVDKHEDKTSIDEIIKNVLEQDPDVQKTFENLGNFERENEKGISKNIDDLFYTKNDIELLTDGSKKIGDKKGITSEITKLKAEIADLKKKSGMTDDEIKKYNDLIEKITELRDKQEKTDNDLSQLESLKTENIFSDPSLFGLSDHIYKILLKDYEEIKLKTSKEWLAKIEVQEKEAKNEKIRIKTELDKLYTEFNPLLEKAKKSKSLEEKIKKLSSEEENLKAIIAEETKIKDLKDKYETLITEIANKQAKFFEEMFNGKTEILKQAVIDGAITFDLSITFRGNNFQESFVNEICNLKNINQFENGLLNEYKYSDSTKLKEDIEKIVRGILNGNLVLKNSYTKKEAITKLVVNWFIFDYKIKQNGDELSHMSPGKKSFVLLKLLIELDNSKCPILLDQPEDDLDNRSIYDDLVKFIKDKKKERQIIIATHNPNLVVGADAECVIVANQNGDKSKNKTYKFEYVEGALENSFELTGEDKILYKQGIQEHVCDILEGGRTAFKQRKNKYNIN